MAFNAQWGKDPESFRAGFNDVPFQKLGLCPSKGSHGAALYSDLLLQVAFGPYIITLFLYTSLLLPKRYFSCNYVMALTRNFTPLPQCIYISVGVQLTDMTASITLIPVTSFLVLQNEAIIQQQFLTWKLSMSGFALLTRGKNPNPTKTTRAKPWQGKLMRGIRLVKVSIGKPRHLKNSFLW